MTEKRRKVMWFSDDLTEMDIDLLRKKADRACKRLEVKRCAYELKLAAGAFRNALLSRFGLRR